MNYKLLACVAVLLVVLIFPASATMVSFLIVETGIHEDIPSAQYSDLWEGGLMSSFFDAGYIVTNSPIMRLEQRPVPDLTGPVRTDFEGARLGGGEYFVLCFLNYQVQGRRAVPVDINIRTYRIDTQELVFERSFPVGTGRNLHEELQLAQNAGRVLVSQIGDR